MAHDHDHFHSKEELNNYLVQQIFTIAICGAVGAVAVSLYARGSLWWLASGFHKCVLLGGIALLVMVVIRAIAVWRLVGELSSAVGHEHAHDHAHTHDHAHDHGCCDHDHSHAPEHTHAIAASPAVMAATAGGHSLNVLPSPAPASSLPLAGPAHDHEHDHDHDHACCGHEHDHTHALTPATNGTPGHDHEDDHDHGWAPWRFVLLLLPVALFILKLPNTGFSDANAETIDASKVDTSKRTNEATGDDWELGFKALEEAAMTPDLRAGYAGKRVRLIGQYLNINDHQFTLVRYMMKCCAADALALKSMIIINPSPGMDPKEAKLNPNQYRNKWVEVTGRVQFLPKTTGTNQYITTLIITPTEKEPLSQLVEIVNQPPNPFLN